MYIDFNVYYYLMSDSKQKCCSIDIYHIHSLHVIHNSIGLVNLVHL